jgi:hypothetical protein
MRKKFVTGCNKRSIGPLSNTCLDNDLLVQCFLGFPSSLEDLSTLPDEKQVKKIEESFLDAVASNRLESVRMRPEPARELVQWLLVILIRPVVPVEVG